VTCPRCHPGLCRAVATWRPPRSARSRC
jgi:hypothetical protein